MASLTHRTMRSLRIASLGAALTVCAFSACNRAADETPEKSAATQAERVRLYKLISSDYRVGGSLVSSPLPNAFRELEPFSHSSVASVKETAVEFLKHPPEESQKKIVDLTESGKAADAEFVAFTATSKTDEEFKLKVEAAAHRTQSKIDDLFQGMADLADGGSTSVRSLLRDEQKTKRSQLDSKSFEVTCGKTFDTEGGIAVHLQNGTSANLHHCLFIYTVKPDATKVAEEKKRQQQPSPLLSGAAGQTPLATDVKLGARLAAIKDPMVLFDYWRSTSVPYWSLVGKDLTNVVFVPEWKAGTAVEFAVVTEMQKPFVASAEITVLTDEGEIKPITLSADQILAGK